jgi:Nascent polypeptide associated complex NAC
MIVNVNQDDVNFIASQAGVSEEIAKKVLMEEKGDVAKALIRLKGKSV